MVPRLVVTVMIAAGYDALVAFSQDNVTDWAAAGYPIGSGGDYNGIDNR